MIDDIDLGIMCDGTCGRLLLHGTPARIKCTGQAIYTVSAHRVDHCHNGILTAVLCPQCTAALLQTYGDLLVDGPIRCQCCEKILTALHDVIQVDHLITGSRIG